MSEHNIAQNDRPKAAGFATAPIVEAVFAIQPRQEFQDKDLKAAAEKLLPHYSKMIEMPFAEFSYDAEAATVDVKPNRTTYRLEGEDTSELAVLRPEGLFVSQLAPYRSWDDLFKRFKRDLLAAEPVFSDNGIGRIACRYINRIDVPFEGTVARYEDYLSVYIHVPDSIEAIGPFQIRFELRVPEIQSLAVIQSGVMPPAVEGQASFALDIDLSQNFDLDLPFKKVLDEFSKFRGTKNELYRKFLTQKALDQFQ
jgi:uncharacterized protein (TIGR04255 family)